MEEGGGRGKKRDRVDGKRTRRERNERNEAVTRLADQARIYACVCVCEGRSAFVHKRWAKNRRHTARNNPVLGTSPQLLNLMTSKANLIRPTPIVEYNLSTFDRSLSGENSWSGDGWRSSRGGWEEIRCGGASWTDRICLSNVRRRTSCLWLRG